MIKINIDDSLIEKEFSEMNQKINLQKEYIVSLKNKIDILESLQEASICEVKKLSEAVLLLQDKSAWNIFTESIKKLLNIGKPSRLKETIIKE
jgi:hypothetical protein